MPLTDTFQDFKHELGEKVRVAKATGVSSETIHSRAESVGDWLAQHYDPKSPEQRLLKELWQVSDQQQQHAIADAVVKLVER